MSHFTRSKKSSAEIIQRLEFHANTCSLDTVLKLLRENRLSTLGNEQVIRDRLTRFQKRLIETETVHWDPILDVEKPSPKDIEREIRSFDPIRIVDELKKNHCNIKGNLYILRDRLNRFYLNLLKYDTRWSAVDLERSHNLDSDSMTKSKNSKNYHSKRHTKSKSRSKSTNMSDNQDSGNTRPGQSEIPPTMPNVPQNTDIPNASNTDNLDNSQKNATKNGELAKNNQEPDNRVVTHTDLNTALSTMMMSVNSAIEKAVVEITAQFLRMSESISSAESSKRSLLSSTVRKPFKKSKITDLSPILKTLKTKSKSSIDTCQKSTTSDLESDSEPDRYNNSKDISSAEEFRRCLKNLQLDTKKSSRRDPRKSNQRKEKKRETSKNRRKTRRQKPRTRRDGGKFRRRSRSSSSSEYPSRRTRSRVSYRRHSSPSSDSSRSSSTSSDSSFSNRKRRSHHKSRFNYTQTYKIMKSFDLKFHGNDNENAELFLDELKDCIENSDISKDRALKAIPRLLFGQAKKWYQGEKRYFENWKSFEKKFRKRFVPLRNDRDIYEDLYGRTQGEDENIAEFIGNFKLIAALLKHVPREKVLVEIAEKNLLPKYRNWINDRRISTFDLLLSIGQKCERRLEENKRYVPPRNKDLMHVKYAAYKPKEKKSKDKLASTTDKISAVESSKSKAPKKKSRKKKTDDESVDNTAAIVQPQTPKVTQKSRIPAKPFPGTCTICNEYGHKGYFCPKKNGRMVCVGCGKLDMIISNFERCIEYKKKRQENKQTDSEMSPPPSSK